MRKTVWVAMAWLVGAAVASAQTMLPPVRHPDPPTPTPKLGLDDVPARPTSSPAERLTPSPEPTLAPGQELWAPAPGTAGPGFGMDEDHEPGDFDENPHYGCCPSPKCRPFRIWTSGEYLMWWLKDQPVPVPLVTTGPAATSGAIGPGTTTLYGADKIDLDFASGMRFAVGAANICQNLGLELTGFILEQKTDEFAINSPGSFVLARPFINAVTGQQSSLLVASPGAFSGGVQTDVQTQLFGGEANAIANIYTGPVVSFDFLAGFRYLQLQENIDVLQRSEVLGGGIGAVGNNILLPNTSSAVQDRFRARTEFYGGQIGLASEFHNGRLFLFFVGKMGYGRNFQNVDINGKTTTPAGTVPGGLLAVASNSGQKAESEISIVPEGSMTVGYQLTEGIRVFFGYNFIYWTDVVRPGNLIDRRVNPGQVPSSPTFGSNLGPNQPTLTVRSSDFWVQGLNLGVAFRY